VDVVVVELAVEEDVAVSVDPVVEPLLAEESVDVDDVLEVSALAKPGEATTITPIPNAAANAPTRPTYRLQLLTFEFIAVMVILTRHGGVVRQVGVHLPNVK
jgi:hypothetical protein